MNIKDLRKYNYIFKNIEPENDLDLIIKTMTKTS